MTQARKEYRQDHSINKESSSDSSFERVQALSTDYKLVLNELEIMQFMEDLLNESSAELRLKIFRDQNLKSHLNA